MATAISANKAELIAIANAVASEKMIDKGIVIEAMEERSSAPPGPATVPRTTSALSSTRTRVTCVCGASSRWSSRSMIITSRST